MPSLTKIKGLSTYHSEIQREPGSLTIADNIVINANNIAEPRRGVKNYGDVLPSSSDRVKQLLTYRDRIIRHYGTTLQFDSNGTGTFTAFNGSYTEPETDIRMKSVQSNGNFYFTSTDGIKKISALSSSEFTSDAGYITGAGGPKALDVIGNIVPVVGGFLQVDKAVAYRIVWGIKDNNTNVILGEPSGRLVITNPTGSSDSDVSLTFSVPVDVDTTDYFYQVYRTGVISGATTDPGDDMNLVFEDNYDGSATSITITEQQPESFRASGTLLYTNPNSGDGIASANAKPPIAKDVALFNNSVFYANTTTVQNTQTTLLGLSGFVSGSTKFNISNSTATREYTFVGDTESTPVLCDTFANTTDAGYIRLYSANDERNYAIWLDKTGSSTAPTVSGAILISVNISADVTAADISDAIKTACDANGSFVVDFTTTDNTGTLTFLAIKNGSCTDGTVNSLGGAWVIEFPETTPVTCDTKTNTTESGYVHIYSASDVNHYTVWMNKGAGNSPGVGGATSIEVDLTVLTDTTWTISDYTTSQITEVGHGYTTGVKIALSTSGTLPTLLSSGDYWIIRIDNDTYELADSLANALLGTGVVFINSTGSGTHTTAADNVNGVSNQVKVIVDANGSFAADFTTTDNSGSLLFETTTNTNATNTTLNSMGGAWALGTIINGESRIQGDGFDYDTTNGGDILLSSLSSVAGSIDETARSLVRGINQDTNGVCYAYYLSGPDDLPGIIRLEARNLSDSSFYLSVTGANIGSKFSPTLPETVTGTAIGTNDEISAASHGFVVNDSVYVYGQPTTAYGTDSTPVLLGNYFIKTVPTAGTFTLASTLGGTQIDITGTSSSLHGVYFKASQVSSNEQNPHYLYFSKSDQPEAVPLVNFLQIGSKSSPIERIIPLRDSLYVLKTEGVYQVTGTGPASFGSFLYDNTVGIIAPDSAAVLDNQIYFLSDSGVTQIADTGTQTISRDIENKLLEVTKSGFNHRTASFGVSYETDRGYMLYLPTLNSDTTATQSYRYNPFNSSWTRWMIRDNTCGIVSPASNETNSNQLFLGAGDREYIEKERKDLDRSDYADQEFTVTLVSNALTVNSNIIKVPTTTGLSIGDTFVQSQYMSTSRFNRLLKMLDLDTLLDDTDYFSTLEIFQGDDSAAKLLSLVTKVNTDDATLSYTTPSGTTFSVIGDDYNVLVAELNASAGVFQTNYPTISKAYSLDYEVIITEIDIPNIQVTVGFSMPLLKGDVTHYKGYTCEVEFAPQHFGDPGILKHTPESSFIFDSNNFYSAIAGFKSDVSGAVSEINFRGKGPGFWGGSNWGKGIWGGLGNDNPFRVLVPRNKARNRYLICRFSHKNARESFKLLGVSIKMKPSSSRAYKD